MVGRVSELVPFDSQQLYVLFYYFLEFGIFFGRISVLIIIKYI